MTRAADDMCFTGTSSVEPARKKAKEADSLISLGFCKGTHGVSPRSHQLDDDDAGETAQGPDGQETKENKWWRDLHDASYEGIRLARIILETCTKIADGLAFVARIGVRYTLHK